MAQKRKAKAPVKRVAVKRPVAKKKRSKAIVSRPRFSRKSLSIFGLAFAVVGAFFLFRIFAATVQVHYFGTLTQSKQSVSYKLTTGAGNMGVTFSNNTADVTLTVKNKAGTTVGTIKSVGKKDVKKTFAIPADTYTISLNTTAKFTGSKARKGYSIHISYPTKEVSTPTAIISAPLNNVTLQGTVNFTAIATSTLGIDRVEFYVDGNLMDTDKTSPYTVKWDTTKSPNGDHVFSVKAFDTAGSVAEASGNADIDNTDLPPQPCTDCETSRFPGDPNPKVTGKIYWGAAVGGNSDPTPLENAAGKSLSVRRTYWKWDEATNMNHNMYKTIDADLKANRLPFVSIKTPGWAAMGNGTYDKELDSILKKIDSYGKPVWFVVFHEPEGGSGSNVPNDPDGAPAWRAMQTRVRQRMTAIGTKNIAFMPTLMSYTWNPASGRTPNDWWVPGIWDAYIVDHYRDNESGDLFTNGIWNNFVTWIEGKGANTIPYGNGEWGNRGTNATAANEMQAYWDWAFTNKKDMIAYTYFSSGLNSPNGSWVLAGEQLTKFTNILGTDSRVQRINDL